MNGAEPLRVGLADEQDSDPWEFELKVFREVLYNAASPCLARLALDNQTADVPRG